jgi:hypothetical protein
MDIELSRPTAKGKLIIYGDTTEVDIFLIIT